MLMKDSYWMSSVEIKCILFAGRCHHWKHEHICTVFAKYFINTFSWRCVPATFKQLLWIFRQWFSVFPFFLNLFYFFCWNVFIFLSQWWVTGGLEDLHPPPPPSREREATPHSLHIWKVTTVFWGRMKYAYHTLTVTVLLSVLSVTSTVVVQEKQTISWREWDFAMREHTSGCSPTPLNSFCLTIKYWRNDCHHCRKNKVYKQSSLLQSLLHLIDFCMYRRKHCFLWLIMQRMTAEIKTSCNSLILM